MIKNLRIFAFVFLLFTFSFSSAGEKAIVIVIDVSHGGKDDGFAIDGFKEKDLAFEIALKVVALNKADDVKIILTREGDYFVSLNDRVEYINSLNPDYVISLHMNASDDIEINGFDFFVSSENSLSEKSNVLAHALENSIATEFSTNGIKNANFNILKNVESPIIVIEMGYLSNANDRSILISDDGQQKIAQAIYNTIK
ncbi:MAG TPA: N-acetylmuramoyl-L-alanine amidase [Aequorivita sp.]|nr:N-acetylmuramoyl-L-alanine amidase [Aequorivita sp.]